MTKTWRLKFLYFCIIFKTPTKEANRFQFSILQNMSLDANAMIFFFKYVWLVHLYIKISKINVQSKCLTPPSNHEPHLHKV